MTTEKHDLTYPNYIAGALHLDSGWYTRGELEALLAHLDQLNFMNESHIKETNAKRPE
jgi:hypothetical protein